MKYDVTAIQLEPSTIIDLKADTKDLLDWLPDDYLPLPDKPNTAASSEHGELYWVGPDHWLLRSREPEQPELVPLLNMDCVPDSISAVVISDSLTFFSLTGPQADQIISIICPLDLDPRVFPHNAVTYSEAFGLKALLIRRTDGFELAVDYSYQDMMRDVLTRAGANFEIGSK